MITKTEIKNSYQALLATELLKYGFKLNKQTSEFTQKTSYGWNKFQLIFLKRNSGWEVGFGMLIRLDEVEKIYHMGSYFEEKYHHTTPTIGITIGTYKKNEDEYKLFINEDSDLNECYLKTIEFFKKNAIEFYQEYNTIEALDKAINIEVGDSIFSGLKYEGNLGIILAGLSNNPNFSFFEQKYRDFYKKEYKGFYLKEYEDVLKAVKKCVGILP